MTRYPSRYEFGYKVVEHKGKKITTSLTEEMDTTIQNLEDDYEVTMGRIPKYHDSRPDLTSDAFYSSPKYWWLILMYNTMEDPFNNFNPGDIVRIPEI
jgi:hypothetical protein